MSYVATHDVDEIRPPTPRLSRAAVIGLLLVAGGSFASGFLHQVVGPLVLEPPVDIAPDAVQAARLVPIEPVIAPAMQVAEAAPAPKPAAKVDVPAPVSPAVAPAPEPVTALAVTDATTAASAAAPTEPAAESAPPADTPPT